MSLKVQQNRKSGPQGELRKPSKEYNQLGRYRKLADDTEKGEPLLTLGPNYLFFLIAFLIANTISVILIVKLSQYQRLTPFFYLSIVILFYLDVVWLATALINPGISTPSIEPGEMCAKCLEYGREIVQKGDTVHCQECQVCIKDQVMHFKLIGGCVGKNNFIAFKLLIMGIFMWSLSLITIVPQLLNLI